MILFINILSIFVGVKGLLIELDRGAMKRECRANR